jgi:hypothetical protein
LLYHSTAPALRWLSDCWLRLNFFDHRRTNLLAKFNEFDLAVLGKSSARGDQVAHDHILFESAKPVDLPRRCLSKHARRVLNDAAR